MELPQSESVVLAAGDVLRTTRYSVLLEGQTGQLFRQNINCERAL